ncbi:STAS domain-containing protein [Micromonosporaceae bacterium Da 78-11]
MPDDCFSITVTHHTGVGAVMQYRVRLTGELDITAGEQLRIVLNGFITTGTADCIIVDLDNLAFLDSEGVRALLDCYFAATWAGKDFHVRNAHGIVHRVLTVLGLLPLLDTTSS